MTYTDACVLHAEDMHDTCVRYFCLRAQSLSCVKDNEFQVLLLLVSGFLWKLIEHGFYPDDRSPPERRNAGPTDFVSSPTMAGGLFAADRDFFLNDLGGYDEQFQYWGRFNISHSFWILPNSNSNSLLRFCTRN